VNRLSRDLKLAELDRAVALLRDIQVRLGQRPGAVVPP
jgi:hypothetical protein